MPIFRYLNHALGKINGQVNLLRRDPEAFGRNVSQFTHPAQFEKRLIDVMNAVPMHVTVDPALAAKPYLNVLNSALNPSGMTGGPNTIINLALRVARLGIPLRLVTTVEPPGVTLAWFREHASQLLGGAVPDVEIVSAATASDPLRIGPNDLFLATHWTTAQQLKPVLRQMRTQRFFYMLQEFEPAFYAWSSNYALALETYGMDFWPVFNERLLADFMLAQPIGRFGEPDTSERAIIFEPATETRLFHPPQSRAVRPNRLLFYARPTNTRNMFGLALTALRAASADPVFDGWEFLSIGGRGSVPELALHGTHRLTPAPWMNYAGYAASLQQADLLLCPMLSPHTSYPVLEMAACGGLSVTNSFANKTPEAFAALSDNIHTAAPTIESMTEKLVEAAKRIQAGHPREASLRMPRDWAETLDPAAQHMAEAFRAAQLA